MRTTKARVFVFLTLVILTAVFSANALTANASAATTDTAATQQSGFIASSFNNILSFFGLAEAAKPAADKTGENGCDTAPEGLLACYRGDLDASDAKGVHNGDWVGVYGYATGKVGAGSFNFNGSNRVEVGNAPDLNPTNVTVDGWVNLSTAEGSFGLISKGDAYGLSVRGGHVVFTSRNAEGVIETLEGPTVKVGAWTHIAATHDGSMRRIYVDGKEVKSGAQSGLFGGDESAMLIGNTTTNDAAFTAMADEVKVFGRALSAKEIEGIAGSRTNSPDAINAVAISLSPNPIVEGNNLMTVTLTRTGGVATPMVSTVTVVGSGGSPATGGVSCAIGVDYVLTASNVPFGAGNGVAVTTIQICPDALAEGNETFTVSSTSNPAGENGAPVVGTITDDDVVAASVNSPVTEGNPGAAGVMTWTLNRGAGAGAASPAFAVPFTMSGSAQFTVSTATSAQDYTLASGTCIVAFAPATNTGTATFAANDPSATCTVIGNVTTDDFVENNETAQLNIAAPIGGPTTAQSTINNDDNPWISVAVSANQNDGGRQYVEEGAPQTGAAAGALRYTFTRGLCALAVPGDAGNVGAAPLCPGGDASALPAGGANFTTDSGTAKSSTGDFAAVTSPINFAAAATSNFFDINPGDDILVENDESLIVQVTAAGGTALNYNVDSNSNAGTPSTTTDIATGFINDDDEDVSVTVAGSPTTEGGAPLVYTFTRTALSGANPTAINGIDPRADNITVNFTLGGAATAATCADTSDYVISAGPGAAATTQGNCVGSVTINGGTNAAAVNFTPTNDGIPENQENVLVTIVANGSQYGVGSPNATATNASVNGIIQNDDFQVIVEGANPATVLEDGPTDLVYTFVRIGDNAPVGGHVVNFNTAGSANPVTGPDFVITGAVTYVPQVVGNSAGTINVPAGNSTTRGGIAAQTALLTANPSVDSDVELDENVLVSVDNGVNYSPGSPQNANGVILNDDSVVSVAVAPSSVTEDGPGTLAYTFTRTGGCGAALSVNYSATGSAGLTNSDITGTTLGAQTVVFAATQCTATVTVGAVDDATPEADESLTLTVTASSGAPNQYTIAPGPNNAATGTITNDDTGISVVASAPIAEDGAPVITYTFTRDGNIAGGLTVNYTLSGSATLTNSDFVNPPTLGPNTVAFAPGSATATVTIDAVADNEVEPNEDVTVTITNGSGYTVGAPATATSQINNDDTDIVCTGPVPASVNENSGTAMVYTCTRTGVTASALSVQFALSGSATFATDYTVGGNTSGNSAAGGTLNFGAGSATATVNVTPVADVVVEDNETVVVTFTNPGVYSGFDFVPSPTALTGTITNDDQDVSVAVSLTNPVAAGNTVTENGTQNLLYTFTRNPGSTALLNAPLTVNFTTTGVAVSGTDYTQSATGTITFAAGSTTATMVVDPTPDAVVEPDEDVIITVTAGTGYAVVAPASATGIIANDDTTYTIEFVGVAGAASGAGREGNPADAGETLATFRVRRNGANSPAGNVDVSTIPASGTATAGAPNTTCQPGQDYTSDGRTIVFTAGGDAFEDFTVRICRDLVFELTETFDAQLTNPVGGNLGTPALATATILDDDAAPTLSINDVTVNENAGTVTLTVTQSITSTLNTSFSFSTGAVGDTATANVDYTSTASTGSIPAGSTTASITIPIIDDNFDEPNEFFTVTLGNSPTNATINDGIGIVTIVDNEPNTTFAINNVVQIEGNPNLPDPNVASTSAFNFRITRTGDAQASETVCFETVDGDIENPAVNPNPATGGPGGTIPSNLGTPDYTSRVAGPTNCVTFTQGGASVITVPVIVYGDIVNEFDESFTVRIISVNGVSNPLDQNNNPRITDALGLGVIQNDDGAPSISISAASPVAEGNTPSTGGTATFTVTRTGSTANPVTASWATTAGTATAGTACVADNAVDFITSSGTITIPANASSTTFTVPYCGDLYDENNETFSASISNPSNGVIGTSSATVTITDDDAAPIISVSDVSVCEPETGTAAAVFTITRTGPSYLTSTVNVNTVDGTATTTDNDYVGILTPGGQLVTFNSGETTKTVSVTVNGDTKFETDETFTLQIVNNSSDVVVNPAGGADPIGLGVIVNSGAGCTGDAAPSFSAGPVVQNEGTAAGNAAAPFFVRVTRTGTTQVPATLTYSTASTGSATGGASCATAGVDYITVTNSTINFPAGGFTPLTTGGTYGGAQGANFVDVPVQVCQDATFEPNETFNVTLSSVAFATINPAGSPALVTITNDDGLSFQIRNPGPEGAEGNVGNTIFTFTIDRIGDSSVASNVCYQTVAGTATEGVDYIGLAAGAANCVNFTAGTTSANVAVTVVGDTTPEFDETFFLRLISATQGTIPNVGTGDRVATINNDDGVPPPPSGKEGDVVDGSGQPAGDGVLLANDVSVLRNFVLGTATPVTTPNQFQRADINGTCGDGAINAADVTVARQWLLNSTPLPDACGPTVAAAANPADESRPDVVGRIIRAVNVTGIVGQQVTVQFQLDSQGDEASASFTANWNPAVLTYVSASLGNGVPSNTNLGLNTTQTAQGRLGVLLDSTNTYATGTRQILTVTFSIPANAAAGVYPITFSGVPTAQSVSSANGTLLATTYESGNVTINVTAAGVHVGGRVTTAGGQALRNATVVLTDAQGNKRTVTTGSFGIYSFDDVEVGQSYVIGVQSKRYRFGSRVVNVTDSLADVDFVGQE